MGINQYLEALHFQILGMARQDGQPADRPRSVWHVLGSCALHGAKDGSVADLKQQTSQRELTRDILEDCRSIRYVGCFF